ASLDMKAADAGATHYRITSATGMNKLSGTAVLYR
ncbi:YdgH/BhsA/McbA-like domain containing protein, partial [Klebsiella pneumoniae]